MSDNKKVEDMKDKISNMYSDATKQEKIVRGSGGNPVETSKLLDALRSKNGLTQEEAGILLNGTVDNYKNADPEGSRTRGKIRNAWRSIDSKNEVSTAHKGSKHDQVYFIVNADNYKFWYREYIISQGLSEKLDSGSKSKNDADVVAKLVKS